MKQKDPSAAEPLLCHRLDNPTEGLILLAKTVEAQLALQDAFRNHQIHKEYTCIVRGTPSPARGVLSHWLLKDARRSRVNVIPEERRGAKKIITEYSVMEKGECARLHIRLHTGRTHQIRAHMAFIGHPLLGDDVYCSGKSPYKLQGQTLHARILGFNHPRTGEYMEFEAPLPDYFTKILNDLS